MKPTSEYKVYVTDTDGSERKFNHIKAKSEGHARTIAKAMGARKITSIEKIVFVEKK